MFHECATLKIIYICVYYNVHFEIKWFNDILQEQFKTQYSNSKACFAALLIPGSWETKDVQQAYFNILLKKECTNIWKTKRLFIKYSCVQLIFLKSFTLKFYTHGCIKCT